MPKVDFAQDMVIALFVDAGTYTTAPAIHSIRKVGTTIHVTCQMFSRPWPMIDPAAAIKVPRVEGDVVFEDVH